MSDANGPYTHSMYAGDAKMMNVAYSEGFKAGRASRHWLASRLLAYTRHSDSCGDMDAFNQEDRKACNCGLAELKAALDADEEEK